MDFSKAFNENALAIALREHGLSVVQQLPIEVSFRGTLVGDFRGDLVVEGAVLLELKAARAIDPIYEAQIELPEGDKTGNRFASQLRPHAGIQTVRL